jgi:ABC transporter substrate binding protein
MKRIGQGVLQPGKLISWLRPALLPAICLLPIFFLAQSVHADTSPVEKAPQHHVYIIHSPGNKLHSEIINKISVNIAGERPDIVITTVTPGNKPEVADADSDLIIGIGREGMLSADRDYRKPKKLFISTSSNKYRLDPDRNRDDAILYMTQPYCRQIELIKLLNDQWKTISIINNSKNPIDRTTLRECANRHGFKLHNVTLSDEEDLTDKIRHALQHSDILLALPDSSVYNKKTVKNILLTSYRYRKPVVAFSKNFVTAGAIAAIHSNKDQIAENASNIIEQYFDSGSHFTQQTYHPETFEISINYQVFQALELPLPDETWIKQVLEESDDRTEGDTRDRPR